MAKKKLRVSKEELYLAVLLTCGPPPRQLTPYIGQLGTLLAMTRFAQLCANSPWHQKFTQLCIDNGEAKSRVYDQLKGFMSWHQEAEKRVQVAESAVMEYMKPTE